MRGLLKEARHVNFWGNLRRRNRENYVTLVDLSAA